MNISRNKLYIILSVALVSGYIWFFYCLKASHPGENNTPDLCIFKLLTGLPCPSCGSTRSVIALAHSELLGAMYINPLGLVIALGMVLIPVWILFDVILKKSTLINFYSRMEIFLRKPKIALPLIFLILSNWIWNIIKGV